MREISISAGSRKYTYFLTAGTFDKIGLILRPVIGMRRVLVISQSPVTELYMGRLVESLKSAGMEAECLFMPPGEEGKNFNTIETLLEKALDLNIDRRCVIIALGGGVVGDTAGFLAGIYMRGIDYIQVPTTLLAMVDSSIGGKVAVNVSRGKNMAGVFHQPLAVFADISLLDSLPGEEFSAALGEVIKYGAGFDREFFEWQEQHLRSILGREPRCLLYLVEKSVGLKAHVVEKDEKDRGERMLLNLGHTLAHAVEKAGNYRTFSHGQAVGIGLVYAFVTARRLGRVSGEEVSRVKRLVAGAGLPVKPQGIGFRDFMQIALNDKKWERGNSIFILPEGIGKCSTVSNISEGVLRLAFEEMMEGRTF